MNIRSLLVSILFLVACGGEPPLKVDGSSCGASDECESGMCVEKFQDGVPIPNGMCSRTCNWLPDLTSDCPMDGMGQTCLQYRATGEKLCFDSCTSNEECRLDEGWTCTQVGFFEKACLWPL